MNINLKEERVKVVRICSGKTSFNTFCRKLNKLRKVILVEDSGLQGCDTVSVGHLIVCGSLSVEDKGIMFLRNAGKQ
jgi:hypothetical protein